MRAIGVARIAFLVAVSCAVLPAAVAQTSSPSAEQAPAARDYLVGIEDVLQIVVWNEPDLTRDVTVRPDGYISIPLINDIQVAGFSVHEIRNKIQLQLSKYIEEPSVTVIVDEINSFRVFVLGEVNQQGMLTFGRPTRLLQALASSGGLTEYSKKEAVILRESAEGEVRLQVDLKRLMSGTAGANNPYLTPNDTILVF